jgi:flavodoxin
MSSLGSRRGNDALVVYDSTHGNAEKMVQAIGQSIGCPLRRVGEITPADVKGLALLILGSPTHGGFPTPEMDRLLRASPALEGTSVAMFDTRTSTTVFG